MFKRRDAKPPETRELFTYIHQGTVVEGKLTAEGRVRVHGTVRGDVTVRGVLEVAESGVVECDDLRADHVKIIGRVTAGHLEATGKVEIWKGGELVGDVRAAALDIEDGARFTGRSEMTAAPATPAAAPAGRAPTDPPSDPTPVDAATASTSADRPTGAATAATTPRADAPAAHTPAELAALIVEP
ncbi:MAG: polymer-forming cytoskeletal protein [Trueperaceae bacterium]|nr:polymer-forming cytoskeletal protein [Trueperaceae bacterium]